MKFGIYTIFCFAVCILAGCSEHYHWSKSHPMYKKAPYANLAVTGTDEAFVLNRSAWFAKKLNFPKDSIQIKIREYCAQVFLSELRREYPKFTRIPDAAIKGFPEESQRLDDRIFMKGHLPEQGVFVKDSVGNIPPYILILHEFIIGTDLKRENYFDYALIHNEESSQKTASNLSAIISYTLWDNEKQRPLFSAVDEVQQPIKKPTLTDFETIIRTSVKQIRVNLYGGVQ